jgi:ABC-type lipoprotein export system ATPase subunit
MSTLLDARGLALSFGPTRVLRDVDISIERGELVAVMGPSGSGKSTLLHCLAGLLQPDAGEVRLDGERIDALSERRRSTVRLSKMGFVFQFGDLIPELTLVENVKTGAADTLVAAPDDTIATMAVAALLGAAVVAVATLPGIGGRLTPDLLRRE